LESGSENYPLVLEYFSIRIWAAPASLGLITLMGWYFGMQNAIYPLILTLVTNILNMALSFLLVRYFDWEIAGVAWSTVIAQYLSFLVGIALLFYKYNDLIKSVKRKILLRTEAMKEFFSINIDIFIRTAFLTFSFAFFYRESSLNGPEILAVNVILMQFLNWMSYGIDGFAFASEALVGKSKGEKDEEGLKEVVKKSFTWAMALALAYSLIYFFGGSFLLGLFTSDAEIIVLGEQYLFWMALMPIIATPSYIWDGVFIGLTASKAMRNCMALAFVIFIISWRLTLPLENHGLWLTLLIFMIARGIIQGVLYFNKGSALGQAKT